MLDKITALIERLDEVEELTKDKPSQVKSFCKAVILMESGVSVSTYGRWFPGKTCSACKKTIQEMAENAPYRFCPNCGARMNLYVSQDLATYQ